MRSPSSTDATKKTLALLMNKSNKEAGAHAQLSVPLHLAANKSYTLS